MIFITKDVGKDHFFIPFLHKTHGNTRHRLLDGHAGIHEDRHPPQTVAIDENHSIQEFSETIVCV